MADIHPSRFSDRDYPSNRHAEFLADTVFYNWVLYILNIEKPYSFVPGDSGGKTWWGLTEKFLSGIGKSGPITKQQAISIYYDYIWTANHCDSMSPIVGWTYGDSVVNHRPRSAARIMQFALNVKPDGIVGPITLRAATNPNINQEKYWKRYREFRVGYYFDIVKNNPSQAKFIEGWVNRMFILAETVVKHKVVTLR